MISLLSIQFTPTRIDKSLSVYYNWYNASANVIEQEVTSKLEGVFNTIKGINNISSTSQKGNGSILMNFKKGVDMDAIRFEVSNLIRQSYSELPEGVSYPSLSKISDGENISPIISYSINNNTNQSTYYIKQFIQNSILPKLSTLKGINKVDVYGIPSFEWVIEYDSKKLYQLNISVGDIQNSITTYLQKRELGNALIGSKNNNSDKEIAIVLTHKPKGEIDWNNIPIKKINNRIIYLKNLAEVTYKEGEVNAYYRVNGLNTVNMVVYPEKGANTIELAKTIRQTINNIKKNIPPGYNVKMTHDTTEFIKEELQKIQKRTLFTFIILFVLILLINRSIKYLTVLFLSIITNLLIAVIFYYIFKVQLHLYSFAGITISFGIIIDNSIIMIDHLRNKGNKNVFLAILAATLTTIGALMVIFLLEESQRLNLWDFSLVIGINMGVSLFVSMYYVPALLKKIKFKKKRIRFSIKRKRCVCRFTTRYISVINWMQNPRIKWAFIMLFILGFGLPIHLLPKELESESIWAKTYNNTLGTEWYNKELRLILEKVLGGSLRLFTQDVFENSYYNEPERSTLRVTGQMPEGCTIEQLNEVILKMENYIGQFDEISLYETHISSPKSSSITIYFKEEFEFDSFPYILKSLLESKAISLGGLNWSVSGVGRGFSNALGTDYRSNNIIIEGYNYNNLYHYAEMLKKQLENKSSGRIKEVEIANGGWRNNKLNEYFLDFDNRGLVIAKVSQNQIYNYLKNQVYSAVITSIVMKHELKQVKIVSDNYQKFNVWDLKNSPIIIDNKQFKLHQFASIKKRKIGNVIEKNNQQYRLTVAYDFLGTPLLAKKERERNIAELQTKLPIGYRVFEDRFDSAWNEKDSKRYYYFFVVILIIFFICAILLESLKQPLTIISMIPLSFIGVFLTFYLFEFNFDQGGYASFILLCGISVNSALYILNEYNDLKKQYAKRNIQKLYFKAFNYKITPIILTIVSTIAGLIPFILGGQNETFWFSFAVGSIGGLIFSLLGIFIYLPLFIVKNNKI